MSAMRRLFLILLLAMLPLQFSWAVAASYCQHEQGKAVTHFGHHAHNHAGNADSDGEPAKKSQPDNDCCICHLAGTNVVPLAESVIACNDSPHPPDIYAFSFHSFIPEGLSKPNWHPAS